MARQSPDPASRSGLDLEEHPTRPPGVRRHLHARAVGRRSHRAPAAVSAVAAAGVSIESGLADRAQRRRLSQRSVSSGEAARHASHRLHRRFVDVRHERQPGRDLSRAGAGAAPSANAAGECRSHELRHPGVHLVSGASAAEGARAGPAAGCAGDRLRHERFRRRGISRPRPRQARSGALARSGQADHVPQRIAGVAEVLRAGYAISSAEHGRLPESRRKGRSGEEQRNGRLQHDRTVDACLAARLHREPSRDDCVGA